MRLLWVLPYIAGLAFLAGCGTSDDSGPPGSKVSGQPAAWEVYTNSASGFCFPNHVDDFKRGRVIHYDRLDQDIGVGYDQFFNQIAVTVFIYPMPAKGPDSTLEGHFGDCKKEVYLAHKGAQLLSSESVQISPGGIQRDGKHAAFTYSEMFAGQMQAVRSEVYLFTNEQKFVLYRTSYPLSQQKKAEPDVALFLNDLTWP
jgi:hypothetical protein